MNHNIVVFAGNDCAPEKREFYFGLAKDLGRELASAGFTVVNGAGNGLMNAVSEGAYEAGGSVIGIGLSEESQTPPSPYIKDLTVIERLVPRQEKLISMGSAFVALPGGVGTMFEIFHILALKRTGELPPDLPLILLDGYYKSFEPIFKNMVADGFIDKNVFDMMVFIETPAEAVKYLKQGSRG